MMVFDLYPTADWPKRKPFSSNYENGVQESTEKADEAQAMTAPAQACGKCKWWKCHAGQENRIEFATGDCTYPLPICLPDEYRITPYAKAGKDCPTWQAK